MAILESASRVLPSLFRNCLLICCAWLEREREEEEIRILYIYIYNYTDTFLIYGLALLNINVPNINVPNINVPNINVLSVGAATYTLTCKYSLFGDGFSPPAKGKALPDRAMIMPVT